MLERQPRTARSLIAIAALFATGLGLPAGAQTSATEPTTAAPAAHPIEQAEALARDGRLVAAKQLLMSVTSGPGGQHGGVTLSDAERERAFQLLNSINRRIRNLNPAEVSLQTADLALPADDLVTAERHANSVQKSLASSPEQVARAARILDAVKLRRAALEPELAARIDEAERLADEDKLDLCREKIDRLTRAGLTLTAEQSARVEVMQSRIVGWERTAPVAQAAVMQPGVVKPVEEGAGAAAEDAQPAEGTVPYREVPPGEMPPPPAAAPTSTTSSAPVSAPSFTPAAAPPAPAPDDLVGIARQFEAQATMAEADHAFGENRLNEAARGYQRALDLFREAMSPEQISRAESRLAEAKVRLRGNLPQDSGALTAVVGDRQLAKQSATAEFENQLALSNAALESGDTGRARDLATSARVTLNTARGLYGEAEFEELSGKVDGLLTRIDQAQEDLANRSAAERTADLKRQADETARTRTQEKERKILESIERVRSLQREMKYEEALQVVDQILFLDPINPAGLVLQDILNDALIYRQYNQIQSQKQLSYSLGSLENQEAMIQPGSIIAYPEDWPQISYNRGEPVNFAEPPENRRVLGILQSKRIPIDVRNNTLEDVLAFVSAVSGVNTDVDWESLEAIGISRETTVSMKLTNVTIETVLNRVLQKVSPDEQSRADWAINDGVLTVASDENLRRNTSLVIYDIRDLLAEVPEFAEAPDFDLNSAAQGGGGGGGTGQSPFQSSEDASLSQRPIEERTQDIINIITRNVDQDGWELNGGSTGFIEQLNGSLIITNTAKNHRAIAGLLSKLREVRNIQINVEARLLLVSQDFFEQIGFDLDVYFNSDNNQVRAARSVDPTIQGSDFFDFERGGLQRAVTGAGRDTNGDGTVDQFTTQGVINPRSTSVIGGAQNSLGITNALLPGSGFAGEVTSVAPALGIAGQFLDDIQVDFLIQATQADRRSVSLTAPRLTFTNGQTSNISVSRSQAYVSDLTVVSSESAAGFDPEISVLNTGVQLVINGVVSSDRRYVQMSLRFTVSEPEGFNTSTVTAVAGGQLVNSADTGSNVQLPLISQTRLETTVSVPDQGTILLGGQRVTNEVEVESGVPVLSKIPILNRFFSNRSKVQEESTLLILLKPTILIQNEEEEKNFPGLLDSLKTGLGG